MARRSPRFRYLGTPPEDVNDEENLQGHYSSQDDYSLKATGFGFSPMSTTGGVISGGTLYTDSFGDEYRFHKFNSSGTFTVSSVGSGNPQTIDLVMIAGGGGGGGSPHAGGGGAGGLVVKIGVSVSQGNYSIVVGNGGSGGSGALGDPWAGNRGSNGGNSTAFGYTALGGGGGGRYNAQDGLSGGSGGGSEYRSSSNNGTATQPSSSTGGWGSNGTHSNTNSYSGGGGGAGGTGGTSNSTGGIGLHEVTIDGTLYNFVQMFGTGSFGVASNNQIYIGGGGGGARYGGSDNL